LKSNTDHIPGICARAAIGQTAALPSSAIINARRRIRRLPAVFSKQHILVELYGNGLIFDVVVVVGPAIVNAVTAFNVSLKTGFSGLDPQRSFARW
jgi:hypothetical protein